MKRRAGEPAWLVCSMLLLVYLSWGSVYIGNKLSLEIAGPFLVCGLRNALAGLLMLGCALPLSGGRRRPSARELLLHAAMAVPLVVAAGGFLVLGQTQVPSSVTGVVLSCGPIFMLAGAAIFAGEPAPTPPQWLGMSTGAAGLIGLSLAEHSAGTVTVFGLLMLGAAMAGWVAGSLIMKKVRVGRDMPMLQSTGFILFFGGLECLLIALGLGEQNSLRPEALRTGTVLAFSWMVIGGSFIAYASYFWLLEHVSMSLAISYEYVVPVIGILLGWLVGGEVITGAILASCAVTIGSVFLVVRRRHSLRVYLRHYFVRRVRRLR